MSKYTFFGIIDAKGYQYIMFCQFLYSLCFIMETEKYLSTAVKADKVWQSLTWDSCYTVRHL